MIRALLLLVFSASTTVLADEPVKFSDALYAKFQHDRCLHCHQFNSRKSNGRAYHSHRTRYLCDKCHTSRLSDLPGGEWLAPPGDRMDYTGLSPRETCLLVKRNSGSGDVNARLLEHLRHDQRVVWALENGMTPMGKMPTVPGGYAAWVKEVDAWAKSGMRCE